MFVERVAGQSARDRSGHWRLSRAAALAALIVSLASHAADEPAAPSAPAADALFAKPYVDKDEWRDAPVRHRYVHGGFKDTDTRFSFYLPPKEQYQGRFFQHITPVPLNENLAQRTPPGEQNFIGFAIDSGGYFIETNGGGQLDFSAPGGAKLDSTITAYRANAAAAQYSRVVAMEMYKSKRPYGYAFGGSGGGYRTIGSAENTKGVWDGTVPFVIGSTMAIPNVFTVRLRALRILNDKLPAIVDAIEPGGGGNPYVGLNAEEAAALREATEMGFPLQSWFGYKTLDLHGLGALYSGIVAADGSYFTDFWTKPGYLGFDRPQEFAKARVQYNSAIAAPITMAEAARLTATADAPSENAGGVDHAFRNLDAEEARRVAGFRLTKVPTNDLRFGELVILSGAGKGKTLPYGRVIGDVVILGANDGKVAAQIAAGDEVRIDNSNFLALETYHRHQVPTPDFKVWDQFRAPDGKPLYPQRPMLLGPMFVQGASGSLQTGRFNGKMIVVESLWDREAFPWQADWYRSRVRAQLGDKSDEHFRLWYTTHALHGYEGAVEDSTRVVSYLGVLQQALRDVSGWVEKGTPPPASTSYNIDHGQVIVPETAAKRKGIQPVVTLTVNGGERADVALGKPVTFNGTITVPAGTGSIVAAEWDFEGAGTFSDTSPVTKKAEAVNVSFTHAFAKPGTYFPALRGISQREGDSRTPYARIQNLGRVRVVVK